MGNNGAMKCPICALTGVRERPFGYEFKDRWLGALECTSCGIIFIHPQPGAEEIRELYSKEYFDSGDFRCGHAGSYFDDATREGLGDDPLLRRIKSIIPSGRFLEVGCAGGVFLNTARSAGYEVQGVEFSEEMTNFARAKFQLDVRAGDLRDAKFPASQFDVVFMGDVLEHLPDPVSSVLEIERVMKVGGILALLCPMQTNTIFSRVGFRAYDALGKRAKVHLPPYHLFEYRRKSMSNLVSHCGFDVIRAAESATPPSGLNLRGSFAQRSLKYLLQYPNVVMTKTMNVFGDRIELFARKRGGGVV